MCQTGYCRLQVCLSSPAIDTCKLAALHSCVWSLNCSSRWNAWLIVTFIWSRIASIGRCHNHPCQQFAIIATQGILRPGSGPTLATAIRACLNSLVDSCVQFLHGLQCRPCSLEKLQHLAGVVFDRCTSAEAMPLSAAAALGRSLTRVFIYLSWHTAFQKAQSYFGQHQLRLQFVYLEGNQPLWSSN